MSIHPTDDRISAYLDGELASSDREVVESAITDADDVRDLVDELRDLGQLLRESSTPEFESLRSAVVDAIPPQPERQAESLTPRRKRPWMWPSVAAVLLVGALGLLVISGPQQDAPPALPSRMLAEADFDVSTMSDERNDSLSVASSAPGGPGYTDGVARVAGMAGSDMPLYQTLRRLGRAPTTGDLVAYLDDQEDEPVLVELTVVDVVQAVDELHVLLRQQGVVEATAPESESGTKPRATGKHYAVYVEAPFACVENVINGMGNSVNVESMTNVNFQYGMAVGGAAPASTLSFDASPLPEAPEERARSLSNEASESTTAPPDGSAPAAEPTSGPQEGLSRFDDRTQNGTARFFNRFRPPPVPLAQTIGANGFLMGIPDVPRLKQQLTEQKLRRGTQAAEKRQGVSGESLNAPVEPQQEAKINGNDGQRNQIPMQQQRQMKALLILEESDDE